MGDESEPGCSSPSHKKAKLDDIPSSQSADAPCCPICLDSWSSTGTHRIVSLKCGHLFGQICIQKWLSGGAGKCPQCNGTARKADIRPIYAKVVSAVDSHERDNAIRQFEAEKLKRSRVEQLHLKTSMQCQLFASENVLMRKRILELENKIMVLESSQNFFSSVITHGRFSFSRSNFVSIEKKAHVFDSDPFTGMIVVSKKLEDSTYYGILKISSMDACHHEFVSLHPNQIRDISFSPNGNSTLLSCSKNKDVKLTCLKSNSGILSYQTNRDSWSCSWSTTNDHVMFCGLQNGEVLVYDIRNSRECTEKIVPSKSTQKCPVISIISVAAPSDRQKEGLLIATLQGITFYSKNSKNEYVGNQLDTPSGALSSVSFEPASSHVLASYKPGVKHPKERHVLLKLTNQGSCEVVRTVEGGPNQHLRSRTSLIPCPDNDNHLIICAGDQSDSSVNIWSTKDMRIMQKWYTNKVEGPIISVGPHRAAGSDYLCVLTNQRINQYKWLLPSSHFDNSLVDTTGLNQAF